MAGVATPWGRASVVEEVRVEQVGAGKELAAVVQLLEDPAGGELVRFAYTAGGVVRRGPVTLRREDLALLRVVLRERPRLRRALGPLGRRPG